MASLPTRNQLLLGTFVHSKSRRELDIVHNAAIAVDTNGKIAAVQRECGSVEAAKEQALNKLGWNATDIDIYVCRDGQFFFPGFIGEYHSLNP